MTVSSMGYIRAVLGPREEMLDGVLREALLDHGLRPMQVDDNAARVLQLLTRIRRPRRVIEVGTYFGYSTIHIARGLVGDARLTTLEIDGDTATMARRNLERAGVADRVDVVVGPAAAYLREVAPGSIGMIFIDADKKSYPEYLKLCFPLLEPGGVLIADDAFSQGDYRPEAADGGDGELEARAINTYNRAIVRSPRLFSAFIGTNNGLLVSYKE